MELFLISKSPLADNAWLFKFRPQQPIAWQAGQFIRIVVPHSRPDGLGDNRRFTIAGTQQDQVITIATRITDTTFKAALLEIPIGGAVTLLDEPAGDFVWQPSPFFHMFLAQGIGITPFLAILKDLSQKKLPANARLYYVTTPGKKVLFEAELSSFAEADPTFQLIFQSTPIEPSLVAKSVPDLKRHIVYVSGPKPLIALCMPPINLPAANLKQDNFPGYPSTAY